ncbi:MAG TPA: cupin domain-containing protein [Ktedonosporobacter sp.]|nr:cupin domain-containing protein [Ktedonosporobacter sp.]
MNTTTNEGEGVVRPLRVEEIEWIEPPQHHSAYSKLLVNPENSATSYFDFRISLYQPKGYVEDHVHERAEHVYYILQGRGLMKLDGRPYVVEPHTAIFIPPGVVHSLANTGLENLLFIVATVPAGELLMTDNWANRSEDNQSDDQNPQEEQA